jgi:gentisate 1,2-dioxygenase
MQDQAIAADVKATRKVFYDKIGKQSHAPLWEVLKGLVPEHPTSKFAPHVWKYAESRPLLLEAGNLLTAEEAERRVLVLENPSMPGGSRLTATMFAGLQMIMPGEIAPAHRHTAGALRMVLEGNGGYTAVAGEKTTMSRGDLVITPSMTWHDHGQEADKPCIWVDGLDMHMVNFHEAAFMDHFNAKTQITSKPEGFAESEFGAGMAPMEERHPFGKTSPIFNYRYAKAKPALMQVAQNSTPDPHLAHTLRYINPQDGGWPMPTIATWLTHVPKGYETRPMRSTDGQGVIVLEGEITLELDGKTFTAGESDIIAIPSWVKKKVKASKDAIFFTMSDRAAQEKLGFYREERI